MSQLVKGQCLVQQEHQDPVLVLNGGNSEWSVTSPHRLLNILNIPPPKISRRIGTLGEAVVSHGWKSSEKERRVGGTGLKTLWEPPSPWVGEGGLYGPAQPGSLIGGE